MKKVKYNKDDLVRKLSNSEEALKEGNIEGVHIYPLGGIRKSSDWANAIIDEKIKLTTEQLNASRNPETIKPLLAVNKWEKYEQSLY